MVELPLSRASVADRFPPPELPFAGDYAERHKAHLQAVFAEPVLLASFERGAQLPDGYGVGLDERIVEYPWLLAAEPRGRALDAGSVLNHEHVLDRLLPAVESLTIVTLEPETVAFTERKVSYVYDDLRELPFRDDLFDTIVSLSTLEHVGMDNTSYGSTVSRAEDPRHRARRCRSRAATGIEAGRSHVAVRPFRAP